MSTLIQHFNADLALHLDERFDDEVAFIFMRLSSIFYRNVVFQERRMRLIASWLLSLRKGNRTFFIGKLGVSMPTLLRFIEKKKGQSFYSLTGLPIVLVLQRCYEFFEYDAQKEYVLPLRPDKYFLMVFPPAKTPVSPLIELNWSFTHLLFSLSLLE
jgi:hypothetical protein